jgi:hypothetical protein
MSSASHEPNPRADRLRQRLARRSQRGWRLWLALGALLLVPLVAGFALWRSYRGAEAKAAARVEQWGGHVTWSGGRVDGHVIAISLARTGLDDAGLASFTPWWWHLPHLVDLDLAGTAITDEGLAHVSGAGIKHLNLSGTPVTSGGLRVLAECPALSSVQLSGTQVDDAGVEYLAALPELRTLYLDGAPITDEALRLLESATSLRYLRLGRNRGVSDAGVARLEEALPHIKVTR